jgi:hypothetical protein
MDWDHHMLTGMGLDAEAVRVLRGRLDRDLAERVELALATDRPLELATEVALVAGEQARRLRQAN